MMPTFNSDFIKTCVIIEISVGCLTEGVGVSVCKNNHSLDLISKVPRAYQAIVLMLMVGLNLFLYLMT